MIITSTNNNVSPVNVKQVAIGFTILLIGIMVYLFGRNHDRVFFIHSIDWLYSLHLNRYGLLKTAANHVSPSFIHVCSFSLISCAFIYRPNKNKYFAFCISWIIIGIIFEFGQLLKPEIPSRYFNAWGIGSIIKLTFDYFKYGTYDIFDIINCILGGLVAYVILIFTNKGGTYDEAKASVS